MFAFFRRTKLTRKTTRQRAGSRKPRLEVLEDRVLLNVDLGPIVNPANGHTYYRLMQSNWTDAEREAVSLGGHLATINDQAENDWVYATFHTPQVSLWIGLNDVAAYRDFTWVSGETATYRNWSAGEPHDFGNEDYVEMRDSRAGLWNDLANVDSYTGTTLKGIVEVATPDIDMQSAQLQDAHTVRFTYQTTGNPGPFQVSLYRSTDGITYNPADLIATQPVVSPPENRGSGTFALPSPWIADPDLPYLLVVADPANSISELNENNNSQAVLVPDIAVRDARWVPIQDHHQDASIVRFEYSSVGYDGQVALRLFQSADNTFDSSDVLLQSQTVDVITGQKTIGSFRLESGPSSKVDPNYLVIVAQPLSSLTELDQANNEVSLRVSNPSPLSSELQADAPLADTREDRVELWLRRYRAMIISTASRFRIAPEAIAGAIAWEALNNVKSTLLGPGKVHPFEANDPSNAETVERMGYLPVVGALERLLILRTPEGAITYIGAIMGAFADLADRAGSQANIRSRPEILATLYNGVSRGGTDIRLYNAFGYFRQKVVHGDTYEPGPTMGLWVEENVDYLHRALYS